MKTLAQWAYPAAVLALWILLAANTLSGLSTVEPSLKRPRGCEVGTVPSLGMISDRGDIYSATKGEHKR